MYIKLSICQYFYCLKMHFTECSNQQTPQRLVLTEKSTFSSFKWDSIIILSKYCNLLLEQSTELQKTNRELSPGHAFGSFNGVGSEQVRICLLWHCPLLIPQLLPSLAQLLQNPSTAMKRKWKQFNSTLVNIPKFY